MKAYAAEQGIPVAKLYDAKAKLKRKGVLPGHAPAFAPVRVAGLGKVDTILTIRLPNGIAVDVPDGAAGATVRPVLDALLGRPWCAPPTPGSPSTSAARPWTSVSPSTGWRPWWRPSSTSAPSPRPCSFINRRRDKLKCLYWETNGFCLWYKRLERERFAWPTHRAGEHAITLTVDELNLLLDGFDLAHWRPHQHVRFSAVR